MWAGGDEEQLQAYPVIFVVVINEETDVENLASKVLQLREFLEGSDTKPDPNDESNQLQEVD